MIALVIAIGVTVGISAFCSLLEAMVLSTTAVEIETLKQQFPKRGHLLERFKKEIAETSSAILSLNTIANTLGAALVGWLAALQFPQNENVFIAFGIGMSVGILFFAEIIPKNVAVFNRRFFQRYLIYLLYGVRKLMRPFSWLSAISLRPFLKKGKVLERSDEAILLLAERGAKEGTVTTDASDMITNALRLDEVIVRDIMTPRTVVVAMEQSLTIQQVFERYKVLPFARVPVYKESIDNVVGLVRRRDLLQAKAEGRDEMTMEQLKDKIFFSPENATVLDALRLFLKKHQQLIVVVDEFGSMAGVLAMEDIIEQILGREIFEKDDVAVDMRALARKKVGEDAARSL